MARRRRETRLALLFSGVICIDEKLLPLALQMPLVEIARICYTLLNDL